YFRIDVNAQVRAKAAMRSKRRICVELHETGFTDIRRGLPNHSHITPTNFATLLHLSVSSAISLLKSAGEPGRTVPPSSASRALILGSARLALTSLLSISMMSAGVFLGAPRPEIPLAS